MTFPFGPLSHEKENEEDLKTPIYRQEAIKERKSPNSAHIEREFLTNWFSSSRGKIIDILIGI